MISHVVFDSTIEESNDMQGHMFGNISDSTTYTFGRKHEII